MDGGLSLVWGTVTAVRSGWEGVQEIDVALPDGTSGRALLLRDLLPPLRVGERCLLNTTAAELHLGSGGYHFVVAHDRAVSAQPAEGHLMKLRYTPFQVKVSGPEDPMDDRHVLLEDARRLEGMVVVAIELHSQLAPVAAAFRRRHPDGRLAYVMTDAGALPYRFGRDAEALHRSGLIMAAITAGQAFGGDLEAANVHSALLMAKHLLKAEAAVVGIGPGLLGTATPFGHGGVAQGEALNAAVALGGRALACVRLSSAEGRPRHRGLSHHTAGVLGTVVLRPVTVALPETAPPDVEKALRALESEGGPAHEVVVESLPAGWIELVQESGVTLRSMGRGYTDDPLFFQAAAAAGSLAGRWTDDG